MGPKEGNEFYLYGEGLGVGVRHGALFQVVDTAVCPPCPPHVQSRALLGRGVGQGATTGVPDRAGLWDEQEITASLSFW